MSARRAWQVERMPTGVPNLDILLDGGLTRGSLALLVGGPGTGKTVLAAQMAFHWAAQGMGILWLVMLGEPNEKFLIHLSEMAFYDRRQVGAAIQLVNLTRYLRQGLDEKLAAIRETIHTGGYSFVVIDGFQGLRSFVADEREARLFLSELSSELALMGITLLLTADAGPLHLASDPTLAISDCTMTLEQKMAGGQLRRQIQIPKLRGRPAIGGPHAFTIDSAGVHVYPRLETLTLPSKTASSSEVRQAIGAPGLDHLLGGGVVEGSSTVVVGGPGTGKSLLTEHFLSAGEHEGQHSLLVCSTENPQRLLARADAFGLPLRTAYEEGRLAIECYGPLGWDPDRCAARILLAIADERIRRLAIDGLEHLEQALEMSGRTHAYLTALCQHLQEQRVTAFFTCQVPEIAGLSTTAAPSVAAQVAANLIVLRLVEADGRMRRLLTVLKTRYSRHSPVVAEMLLEEGHLSVVAQPRIKEMERVGEFPYGVPRGQHEGEKIRF